MGTRQVYIDCCDNVLTDCATGQGINAKLTSAIHSAFQDCDVSKITIRENNSAVAPNAGCTGGSVMSECIVAAALDACAQLKVRMEPVKAWLTAADANGMIVAQADFKHPLGLPQEIVNTFSGFMSLAQAGALMGCGPAGQEPAWQQLTVTTPSPGTVLSACIL